MGPLADAFALVGRDVEPTCFPGCCAGSCGGHRQAATCASGFGRYSGLSAIGVVPVVVIVVGLTFGEETGWRGFALPLLQRRYGALAAALLVTPIWALWHLPYFFTVTTYRGFAPVGYVGFVFGLACGSIVLTWLYNGTGGSILACASVARPLQPRDRHRGRQPARSRRSPAPSSTSWRSCSSGSSCASRDAWRAIDPWSSHWRCAS